MNKRSDKSIESVFRKRLKEVRKAKGFTQTQLASAMGVERSTVGVYEYESNPKSPGLGMLQKFADALNIEPTELIAKSESDTRLDQLVKRIKTLPASDLNKVCDLIEDTLKSK